MKPESLKAMQDAYIVERDCIDDEPFALIHPDKAMGERLNNKAL